MPYAVRKTPKGFQVVNTETGELKAKHSSRDKAQAQVRLLRGIEHGMKPRRKR